MGDNLLITVRFHGDGSGTARYHGIAGGNPEWPPSPARVYQALIAGASRGNGLPKVLHAALEWLESLPPPTIAAPHRTLGQSVNLFVPNNDADAVENPRDVSGIRTKKFVQASLFAEDQPILYAWRLPSPSEHSGTIVNAAASLYQVGRGVDMAWAVGEVLDEEATSSRLDAHPGRVYRAELGAAGEHSLACPVVGSLASLEVRHHTSKLRREGEGKTARTLFTNPPKPRFQSVAYERRRNNVLFELRDRVEDKPWPWALPRIVKLVERLRDEAVARLRGALPDYAEQVDGALVGRRASEKVTVAIEQRTRIIPLPSIGFEHADRGIRRFLLEIPSGTPIPPADIEWAFSALEWSDAATGELGPLIVTRSDDESMLRHFQGPSRRWRSVSAVALPETAQRRRIEPTRRREDSKSGSERSNENARATQAVHVALRHAGVHEKAIAVRVQREPFEAKGARAEEFAPDTRFAKERLWHVEIEFDRALKGPIVIGDGRFLGLGILAPTLEGAGGLHEFEIVDGLIDTARHLDVTRALRRAVMARVQQKLGPREDLPTFFSGHDECGGPAQRARDPHLGFAYDARARRLFVIPPHVLERRDVERSERTHLATLERALDGFRELLAGAAGRLTLQLAGAGATSTDILGSAKVWSSATPYVVTRHAKMLSATAAIILDVEAECRRARLPTPAVEVEAVRGVSGLGLTGQVKLTFDVAVSGPIVLGRDRHFGGGMFRSWRP